MRVQCKNPECANDWPFNPRKPAWKLKRDYKVRCPKCHRVVFIRKKRMLMETAEKVRELMAKTLEGMVLD